MKLQTYIRLEKLRFRALHGVLPQERQVGGDFTVTLRIGYPWQAAMDSDAVADTLDYAAVFRLVQREMVLPSQLLEHVAGRIAKALLRDFPHISSIDLWLTKTCPPMGADSEGAGVELHLINDKTEPTL
ncbi:MAG: dihydroneopterin aldolase [Prevotella sp.]|nr:dihydroneopterin aldolase [Prevotella sp.]